jgi:hypothetical protein
VAIFTHASIGGIVDATTLQGFLVGVKAGDACVEHLAAALASAMCSPTPATRRWCRRAIDGRVRVFCLDEPPANYLLYRNDAEELFNKAFTLYG